MTASPFSFRTTAAVALQQIALTALVALFIVGWLHIPDANPIEVAASVVLALLIAAVATAGESAIALRLTNKPITKRQLLIGVAALCCAALLWQATSLLIDHLGVNDGLRAGYLNSRLPASLRNIFSYEHLFVWLGWFWSALRWIVAALLAAAAFACITCDAPVRGLLAIFRSARYWLSLLLLAIVGTIITETLLNWMPGHGLTAELLSLGLRLLTIVVLNAATIASLLQAMARAVLPIQSVGTAEPAISQPRTTDIP